MDCCKELTGWSKAFTKTELLLCVLQAIFLIVFITFMTFLILHLIVCSTNTLMLEKVVSQDQLNKTCEHNIKINKNTSTVENSTNSITSENIQKDHDVVNKKETITQDITVESDITVYSKQITHLASTLDKAVTCTWKPSQKTNSLTIYYDNMQISSITTLQDKTEVETQGVKEIDTFFVESDKQYNLDNNELLVKDLKQTKEIQDSSKISLLALVKVKPPQSITYGCTLTIVSEFWSLTAASCIDAIEEVDSLDSFVIMQGFKEKKQNIHYVADFVIHPQYQGVNMTYDLAALKSENSLVSKGSLAVKLPSMIDYCLITIGESLTILGYGSFKNIDPIDKHLTRSVRQVFVHSMPLFQCPAAQVSRFAQNLLPVVYGSCGAWPLCAGMLRSRSSPCNYCSGTPLLKQNVLLGIMSDNKHCGQSCEPALFVNLAVNKDWLTSVFLK